MYNETQEHRWNDVRNNGEQRQQQLVHRAAQERREKEELARRLSAEATVQLEKTLEGLLAFPAAVSLGIASGVMTFAGFLARGFEIFTRASDDFRRDWRQTGESEMRAGGYDPNQNRERRGENAQTGESTLPRA